ncbi:MAG TPA: lipid kinase [Firmicutes bacterium]|jgi:YegS/Rv2252/BmrU family lipid kinase|nr:lipid kinase [Bacillota bacterium]HBS93690.1 lipid kinase [Bacillota bacterium]
MNNIFVLVNPVSANGTTREVWPKIAEEMKQRGLNFETHMTTAVGNATEAVRNALRNGKTTIIAVGGDGTANEVVNGFFEGETPINPAARLGIISRGTGCDLIKTLGIPKDYPGALDVIASNRAREIDLALVEFSHEDGTPGRRWYANIADAGLGAAVCKRVNHVSKSAGGLLSYLSGTLWSVLSYKNRWARIEADGEKVYEGSLILAGVANGNYFGGGMRLAPIAHIDDGKLDLILVRGMSKLRLLINLPRIYRGTHLSHSKISTYLVDEVMINGEKPLEIEMDGETPGNTPVKISVRRGAIKVLC